MINEKLSWVMIFKSSVYFTILFLVFLCIYISTYRSNLCGNISYLSDVTKLNDVTMVAGWKIRQALKERCTLEPWRENLLTTFMQIKYDKTYEDFNMTKQQLDDFIDSLLIS